MQKTINGAMLKSMFVTAAKLLDINRASIDALNVFPVPDGDTGTNMSMTVQSAIKALMGCQSNKVDEITEAIKILCHQMVALKSLTLCTDFSYEVPSVKSKLKLISLIIKRLTELGLSEDNINTMTANCFNNIDIMTGVE